MQHPPTRLPGLFKSFQMLLISCSLLGILCCGLWWGTGLARAQTNKNVNSYTVAAGDTLIGIAQRFGVSQDALIQLNGLKNPNQLQMGQVLSIPSNAQNGSLKAIATAITYATPGDDLATLAKTYGVEPSLLASLNAISLTARLFPGEPVIIPRANLSSSPLHFGAILSVTLPSQIVQGRTGRTMLSTKRPLQLSGRWNDGPIVFSQVGNLFLRQFALLPVPALQTPGSYSLTITYTAGSGIILSHSWAVPIVAGTYESQPVDLPPDRSELLDPAISQPELDKVTAVWSQVTPHLYSDPAILTPGRCPISYY